ncbi:hypothetical protein JCM5353_001452 [Sporobolomyces roseus]
MLSTAVFSYLLPLSLLQSAIPLSSRPLPSSRISLALPISVRSNNNALSPSLPSLLAKALALPNQQLSNSQGQSQVETVEEGGQWGFSETMQTEIDEDEDAQVWYYGIADEEELRQEKEFWRTLLRATSKNGEISALFRELVEGHNFERSVSSSTSASSRPRDPDSKNELSSQPSSNLAQIVLDPPTNLDSSASLLPIQ